MRILYPALLSIALLLPAGMKACDACGCSLLFMDWGLTPRFGAHQAGLRYQYQAFEAFDDSHAGQEGHATESSEFFHLTELRGQWVIGPRWRLSASVPFAHLRRHLGGERYERTGLTDASVMLQYTWVETPDDSEAPWRHRLSTGLGLKLPTGKYSLEETDQAVNPNFQLGSGSWDVRPYLNYVLRRGAWGMSLDLAGQLNSTNREEYRFGNRANGSWQVFTVIPLGRTGIMPSVGVYGEYAAGDTRYRVDRLHTGGNYWFGQAGVQFFRPGYGLALNYQLPVSQNWADGHVNAKSRLAMQLNFYF
jgi:hypothetical protein